MVRRHLRHRPVLRHCKGLQCSHLFVLCWLSFLTLLPHHAVAAEGLAVYQEVREFLANGNRPLAIRTLDAAAERGTGTLRQALKQRRQLLTQPAPPEDENLRLALFDAMNARERGDLVVAARLCRTILDQQTPSVFSDDAQNLLAYMSLVDQLNFRQAERRYQKLRERFPSSNYFDAALFGEAVSNEKLGEYTKATLLYEELLARHTGISVGLFDIAYPKDNLLSRLWFNRAKAKLKGLENRQDAVKSVEATPGLIIGARLSYDRPVGSGRDLRSTTSWLEHLDVPATHIAHWLTRQTAWEWESAEKVAAAARSGYTPVIIDWYFGDEISPSYVQQNRERYLTRLRNQVIPLLKKTPNAMLILEPEFNKNGMQDWSPWGDLMLEAIQLVHRESQARVGLGIGDWADFESEQSLQSVTQAINASDFVAFLIMTSREHEGAFQSPANDLGGRFNRAMLALDERFNLPVVLAYTAISSAGGWEAQQAHYLSELMALTSQYNGDQLEAVGYFSLFDNPKQQGWFGRAETSFGIFNDQGVAKPAVSAWRSGAKRLRELDQTPPQIGAHSIAINQQGVLEFQASFSEWVRWVVQLPGSNGAAARQLRGAGKVGFAALPLSQADRLATRATLIASDAAGNVARKTVRLNLTPIANSERSESIPVRNWRTTAGASIAPHATRGVTVRFDAPYSQLRMTPSLISDDTTLSLQLASDRPLHGVYLSVASESGTRHRVQIDYLLPRSNTATPHTISIPLREVFESDQHLAPSGALSDLPATGRWTELILENGARPIELQLSALTLIGVTSKPLERSLVNRWGR